MSHSIRELLRGHELVHVRPTDSAQDAAKLMEHEGIGCLVVLAEDGKAAGVVTDRDLALRVAGRQGVVADEIEVSAVMSAPALTIEGTEDVDAAIRMMRARGVRRLVVTDALGVPQTVLSLDDLLEELSRDLHSLSRDAHSQVAGARRDARVAELREEIEEAIEGVTLRLQRANWLTREALVQEVASIKERLERVFHVGSRS